MALTNRRIAVREDAGNVRVCVEVTEGAIASDFVGAQIPVTLRAVSCSALGIAATGNIPLNTIPVSYN